MNGLSIALSLLSPWRRASLEGQDMYNAEEFRLRIGRDFSIVLRGSEHVCPGPKVTEEELLLLLEKATDASLHRAGEAISSGYISYMGLRLGICGMVIADKGQILGFEDYSSVAIRIPRERRGLCSDIYSEIFGQKPCSTLVISPPGGGKTTLLRELIRRLAEDGHKVAVLDERNELSASYRGQAGFDLGRCSDILLGIDKAAGAAMLLRSMTPEYVAMDELSRREDMSVLEDLVGCGIELLASAHAGDKQDLLRRPAYRRMVGMGCFSKLIIIQYKGEERSYRVEDLP